MWAILLLLICFRKTGRQKIWHSLVKSFRMYELKNDFILFYGHCKMLKCSFRLSGFLFRCLYHGNTGSRVFKRGVYNWKDFYLIINIPKGNYWILGLSVMWIVEVSKSSKIWFFKSIVKNHRNLSQFLFHWGTSI